jgi:hypothetical protein
VSPEDRDPDEDTVPWRTGHEQFDYITRKEFEQRIEDGEQPWSPEDAG